MAKPDIGPISSSDEHRRALLRVQRLLRAEPGTPEFEELDGLANRIVAYESKFHPVPRTNRAPLPNCIVDVEGRSDESG